MTQKIFRDPIHGDMALTKEEICLIDTREFQRLRGIRQLGTSHLVFPGAHHTRFEHSLGTCWVAKNMVAELNQRARQAGITEPIDREQARFIAIAALLHDITHIPFGHTIEDERRILPAHDKNRERLRHFLFDGQLGKELKKLDLSQRLFDFFTKNKGLHKHFAYQLVAGPICADLLDYLRRDAYYCGLNLNYDNRVLKYLNLEGDQFCFNLYSEGGFRQDAWSELINLLRIRFHLTERVYFHHGKIVSGAMLSRLLEVALESNAFDPTELYDLRDDAFVYVLDQRIKSQAQSYQTLSDAFASRRFYKRVYMVARDLLRSDYPDQAAMARFQTEFHENRNGARSKLEAKLARQLGVPEAAIIVYAPDIHMQLKEAHVQVRINTGPLVSLADIKHPELDALKDGHRALWRFFVFIDPLYEDRFVRASRLLEKEIGLSNQLELYNQGQMTLGF